VAVTMLVPLVAAPLPFDAVGDLLTVVYLMLLGTFFLALAGLDPGTAFGGMGASREMTVAAIAEPTIALAIFGLAVGAGSTNLGQIVAQNSRLPDSALRAGRRQKGFVIISRRKALSQIIGFLVLENGIAPLAALGTYGIPLIVELGVFLDALMGFLVVQILVYQIKDTFESIDVEQLTRLRH
jgi:hypothetical protein